jgi:hypothetical protein
VARLKAIFGKIFKGAAAHDPRGIVGYHLACDKAISHLVGQHPTKPSLATCFPDTASSRRVG